MDIIEGWISTTCREIPVACGGKRGRGIPPAPVTILHVSSLLFLRDPGRNVVLLSPPKGLTGDCMIPRAPECSQGNSRYRLLMVKSAKIIL